MATPDELTVERLLLIIQNLCGMKTMNSIVRRQLRIALRPLVNQNRRSRRLLDDATDRYHTLLVSVRQRSRKRRKAQRKH